MKKSSNDIVRSLFLMAAMIIIGAGSAFAQTESDYFSLTKNAGTESERTSYYTTFAGAVGAADDGDKITLLQDYTAPTGVSITKSITLDLNAHTYTGDHDHHLITVGSGTTLELVDDGTLPDTKGTITYGNDTGESAIRVLNGGTLHATGVSIVSIEIAIYNYGTAIVNDCVLSGRIGIESNGTTTVTNTSINGIGQGIVVKNGTTTIGEKISIIGKYDYGIFYINGTVTLNALPTFLPTFTNTESHYVSDILISNGHSLAFEQVSLVAPLTAISLKVVDPDTYIAGSASYSNPIATGYEVTVNPNRVFRWYDSSKGYGFGVDGSGNVVMGNGVASVSTYNAGSAPTIAYYLTLADALAAAQAGYIAGDGGDVEEFIPTVTLLADIDAKEKGFVIGDGKTTKMTLDLNDHNITGDKYIEHILIVINDGATLTLVDNGDDKDKMGSIKNNDEFCNGAIFVASGGRLNAKGVIISTIWDTIRNYGTAEFDDCVISGKYAIDIYGTATITNSDIIGGNGSALLVGDEIRDDNGEIQVYDGCLTIGEEVYIRGFVNQGIQYQFGTVILKALPTFGTERPTTSSTTRAKTRDPETYDIAIPPGRSLTFEEGTFNTTDRQPISIFIKKDGVPIDPTTYTNPITTNYSKYVKDGGKVIDPNDVFSWYGNDVNFTCRFRMNAAGEVILNHAAATVTSYDVDNSTVTTTPYYDFSEAIAAANSGYKTASEAGGTEFIPTLKMLDDVSFDTGVEIGNGSTVTKVKLDLNGKEISGAVSGGVITVKSGATLTLVDNGTDPNETGTIENTNTSSARGVMVESGGTLFANGGSIVCSDGYAIFNEGTADINGCDLSAKCGIYSNNTATIANCAISATICGIYEEDGTTTVGEGVSFSGNREASIYKHPGTLTLTAWPTFGGSETEGYADIKLSSGRAVTFSGIGLGAPMQDATLCIESSSGSETATLTFTPNTGYVLNTVDYNNTVITPENGAYTFTMPDADVTITATWKIQTEISVQNTSLELKVLDEVATGATLTNVVSSTAVTDENVTLTYTSSNSNVAVVEGGNIKAIGAGTATITVSFAGNDKYAAAESKTMNVTVSLNDASVSVSDGGKEMTSLNLYVDDTYTIVPTTTPESLAVTYAADGSGVVSVDENGVVTALKAGTGSIVLKVGGDGVYAESSKTVTVNVSKVPTAISLNEPPFGYNFNVRDEVNTGATLSPADAGTLTYTSNNESVAKVEGGNIICLAAGTATITVSFAGNDKYAAAENKTMNVTVSLNDASVSVSDGENEITSLNLYVDDTYTIVPNTTPEGLAVTYAADGSGVVSVDENGKVTALKAGTGTVTVSVGGDGVYAVSSKTVTVNVSKVPTAISVANASLALNVNDEISTGATLSPADAGTLTYTSNNESVAKVEGGNIICLAAGTATITVSFAGNDKYAAAESTISVTVSLNDASVSVDDNAFDLLVGESQAIAATTTPEGLDVTYTADESGVVSVDENGVVTALKDGTATVTVSVGGDGVYAANSTTVTVTVSSYEMANLFSGSNEWTSYVAGRNLGVPAGLTAYIVTALGAETATATEIAYIPQGEPVLLRRSDKTVNSYASYIYTGSAPIPDGNLLKATTATSQPTAYRDFVLYQDAFVLVGEGTLATGKVYLPAPQASQSRDASRSIVVDGDDTTGMSEELRVKGEESDGDWYNLQGRRLGGKPTKKGLYIHNNKMEVVR